MIQLINGYAITADKRQYILMKKTGMDENGNPVYANDGRTYYSTLQGALVAAWKIIGRDQIRKNDYSLKQLYELMLDIEERLTKVAMGLESAERLHMPDYDANDNNDSEVEA